MIEDFKKIPAGKKIYIASDFHLGVPNAEKSLERERKIVRWLDDIKENAQLIILAGDMFDFWFEYKHVIPKGFIRFQGKLAEIRDAGIPIIFYAGNHDMWMFDYFSKELGIPIYQNPESMVFGNKTYLIGHGDGLGLGDRKYKTIKTIFSNSLWQWLFSWLHPTVGFWIAQNWSRRSRKNNCQEDEIFLGEGEVLWQYCKTIEAKTHHDYYIFGHRHLPLDLKVSDSSRYINLGEWFSNYTYVEINHEGAQLKTFDD